MYIGSIEEKSPFVIYLSFWGFDETSTRDRGTQKKNYTRYEAGQTWRKACELVKDSLYVNGELRVYMYNPDRDTGTRLLERCEIDNRQKDRVTDQHPTQLHVGRNSRSVMSLSCWKFCIYTHPVNSKFTTWQEDQTARTIKFLSQWLCSSWIWKLYL